MELFEEIRREYEFGVGTIQMAARKLGVRRRMVRQVLAGANTPARKRPQRRKQRLGPGKRSPRQMLPVYSVTYLPGCSYRPTDSLRRGRASRREPPRQRPSEQ